MLIATLPPIHEEELLRQIVGHPLVDEVRYNTGMVSSRNPKATLEFLMSVSAEYGKKLWLDLKGRQLRIVRWAAPNYGKIILNHRISVNGPATVFFRHDSASVLKDYCGNVIYVDPPPRYAVGAGQSVNILGDVTVDGYLTAQDRKYLEAARSLRHSAFMLSFAEEPSDVESVLDYFTDESLRDPVACVLKIESPRGVALVRSGADFSPQVKLMAARDDLYIQYSPRKTAVLGILKEIAKRDSEAICASRIFSGIEEKGSPALADFSDLALMRYFGYRHFMLSDGLCHRCFEKAIDTWEKWISGGANC